MPGQLPDPDRQRRNAPTIPTTKLPAGGRRGPIPNPPEWIELGRAGQAWWKWAWRTPEACAWDKGQLVKVAHRASLEDDLVAILRAEEVDDMLHNLGDALFLREAKAVVGHLAALVTGRLNVLGKIADIDDKLGLSPKGRDALRLKVVADSDYYGVKKPPEAKVGTAKVSKLSDRRGRLTEPDAS